MCLLKRIRLIVYVFFFFLSGLQVASCMPPNVCDPALEKSKRMLQPWLAELRSKIRAQGEFHQLTDRLKNNSVFCTFLLGEHNEFINLAVEYSSADKSLADQAIQIIRNCAPLSNPPDQLPRKRRVVVLFTCDSGSSNGTNPQIYFAPSQNWRPLRWN